MSLNGPEYGDALYFTPLLSADDQVPVPSKFLYSIQFTLILHRLMTKNLPTYVV